MRAMRVKAKVSGLILTAAAMVGCQQQAENAQLQGAAKRWCESIRASQVIPVYPLQEDVQVGDMYIVDVPVDEEQTRYEKSMGFLPLENHVGRLFPKDDFAKFFYPSNAYLVGDGDPYPPTLWQRAATAAATATAQPARGSEMASVSGLPAGSVLSDPSPASYSTAMATRWAYAPRAAFPTITFNISRSAGVDASFPISGVAVGLGLLGADDATTSISLNDAFSYGLDTENLAALAHVWAKAPAPGQTEPPLQKYAACYKLAGDGKTYRFAQRFLRVVTRVYLVNSVNVSVTETSQTAADIKVQPPFALNLLTPSTQPADVQYQGILKSINDGLGGAAPAVGGSPAAGAKINVGGELQATGFSGRSVTLNQTFARPLVVGYLAIDIPIDRDGNLKDYYAFTLHRIRGSSTTAPHNVHEFVEESPDAYRQINDWLKESDNEKWVRNTFGVPSGQEISAQYVVDRCNAANKGIFGLFADPQADRLAARIQHEVIEAP